ncbi:3'-5' exoribonuclease YhaM [compost metagenome]
METKSSMFDLFEPIIKQPINSLSNDEIRTIVSFCFEKVQNNMYSSPAAKSHHHAYYGGLAYHIVRMLELSEFICQQRISIRIC